VLSRVAKCLAAENPTTPVAPKSTTFMTNEIKPVWRHALDDPLVD
jgi:hypothetical protein